MIKFFRRIRKQLLSENKFSKYVFYALGEILLVVIGILIALSINHWNSGRIDSNKELTYLERLKTDVSNQIEILESISKFCEREAVLADSILSDFKREKDFRKIGDLDKRLGSIMYSIGISKANTTFIELSSTGQLNLIKSAEIRSKTMGFYNNIDGIETMILGNRDNVYYPNVFPVFLEVIDLNAQNFFPSEKGLTTNFHTKDMDERMEARIEIPDLQRKLLNSISLVIMINKTIKSSTQQATVEGEELLARIEVD
ncbi:MAG TPA: DUF6090 family protein [Eudoraea sp.]|nr:DUF6090 family protein [Eudoraea sp.]